jgi:hypothetical protein
MGPWWADFGPLTLAKVRLLDSRTMMSPRDDLEETADNLINFAQLRPAALSLSTALSGLWLRSEGWAFEPPPSRGLADRNRRFEEQRRAQVAEDEPEPEHPWWRREVAGRPCVERERHDRGRSPNPRKGSRSGRSRKTPTGATAMSRSCHDPLAPVG